jgi:hypothetical protein
MKPGPLESFARQPNGGLVVPPTVRAPTAARSRDFTVTQVTGGAPDLGQDTRAQTTPHGEPAMFNPSDFLLTPSDFAKIIRAPEIVLTLVFAAVVLAYFSAASASTFA